MPEVQASSESQHGALATSKCQKSRDENSVNREIATLLLNLASRTQNQSICNNNGSTENDKKEFETEAMDLSTVK